MDIKLIRTRWAAVGAAVAITLGAGGIGITQATTSSGEKPIYKPINPCRLADLRPAPNTVGPRTTGLGPDDTYTLDGWGTVGDCTLPTGTTGLALNVTAVNPTEPTFLRLWPADGTQPTTSNLNPAPGQPPTPNAVNVGLSATGQFNIFNRFGIVNLVIDVVGVYDDHNHDDRYYKKSVVDAAVGAKANSVDVYKKSVVDAAVGAKANSVDVYTKTEVDAAVGAKANSVDVYTKTEVDIGLSEKPDALWAVVESDGRLVRGSPGAVATQLFKPTVDGAYQVDFGTNVTNCVLTATLGRTDSADLNPSPGEVGTAYRFENANAVFVKTYNSSGTASDRSFHLLVIC